MTWYSHKNNKNEVCIPATSFSGVGTMKPQRFYRFIYGLRKQESGAHLAVGALLVVTILYATTII